MWLSLAGRAEGLATRYSTTFSATENPLSEGGIWLNGQTHGVDWHDIQTASGRAYAAVFDTAPGGVQDSVAQLSRAFLACTSAHFSRGTVFVNAPGGDGNEIEAYCNLTIAAHSITGYECYLNMSGAHTLVRWNGAYNDYTPLASNNVSDFTPPASGDVIQINRDPITLQLQCWQNGILRTTATDLTWLGGNPGIGNNPYDNVHTTLGAIAWESWTGGNM